jgi:hypothetical protein
MLELTMTSGFGYLASRLVTPELVLYRVKNRVRDHPAVSENVRFPDSNNDPASVPKFTRNSYVALPVRFNLRNPIRRVRPASQFFSTRSPIPAMPKISIAKHNRSRAMNYDVRLARQGRMKSITHTALPKLLSKKDFGAGISGAIPLFDCGCCR